MKNNIFTILIIMPALLLALCGCALIPPANENNGIGDGGSSDFSVYLFSIGGTLSDGRDHGSFKAGEVASFYAEENGYFLYWMDSEGRCVGYERTLSIPITEGMSSETYTAVFADGPIASFDDMQLGASVGATEVVSNYGRFKYNKTSSGGKVTVVTRDGDDKALKVEKTDTKKGDAVAFDVTDGGDGCYVLEFDLMIDAVRNNAAPLQIFLGKSYKLQLSTNVNYILINDANSDGSVTHFLGGVARLGEWISVRVEYYPAVAPAERYAKAYINGDLAVISQNSYAEDSEQTYTEAKFYSLIASNATYCIDNVCAYTTDEKFVDDADGAVIRYAYGDTGGNDSEALWQACDKVVGEEAGQLLRELNGLFDEDLYIWLANLYDPVTGGFYYSNDARDYDCFFADVESTSQAMGLIPDLGLGKVVEAYTPQMAAKVVAWVRSIQDKDDGYFYHPGWGKDINTSRRGRDLNHAISTLDRFGASPLYPTALDRLSGVASAACLTTPLGHGTVSAVSRVVMTGAASHLESRTAFSAYLDELYRTTLTKNSKGEWVSNSYSIGAILGSQASQIKAAGLTDVCVEFLNGKQNPDNGLWEDEKNYRTASGLLKISGVYNSLGAEMPYADKAIRSSIDIASSEEPLTALVYLFNPLGGAANVMTNLQNYSTREDYEVVREAVFKEVILRAVELTDNTLRKLKTFKKADGSFSYNTTGASANSQGVPVCFGANEGDVNGTGLANATIVSLFKLIGFSRPKPYNAEDRAKFVSALRAADGRAVTKLPADEIFVDYENCDPTTGMPRFVTPMIRSESATVEAYYDSELESNAMRVSSYSGGNDGVTVCVPSIVKEPMVIVFETDIKVTAHSDNIHANLIQIQLAQAFMINVDVSGDSVTLISASNTGAGNKKEPLDITLPQGKWFRIRVEYYVGDADDVYIEIYINGSLAATSYNYFGKKIDGEVLPAPATDAGEVHFRALNAARVDFFLDNTLLYKVE